MKLAAFVALLALTVASALELEKYLAQARQFALNHADKGARQYEAMLTGRRTLQDYQGCLTSNPGCVDESNTEPDFESAECKAIFGCITSGLFTVIDGCLSNYGAIGAYAQCIISLTGVGGSDPVAASEAIIGDSLVSSPESVPDTNEFGSTEADQEFFTTIISGGTIDSAMCTDFFAPTNVLTYAPVVCLGVFEGVTELTPDTPPQCLIADPETQGQGPPIDIFAESDEGSLDTSDPASFATDFGLNDTTLANLKAVITTCDAEIATIDLAGTIDAALDSSAVAYATHVVSVVASFALAVTLA